MKFYIVALGFPSVVSLHYPHLLIREAQTLQSSQIVAAWTFLYFNEAAIICHLLFILKYCFF